MELNSNSSLEVAMNSIRTAVNQDLTRLDNHLHTTSSNLTREIQDLEVRLTDRLETDRNQCRQVSRSRTGLHF